MTPETLQLLLMVLGPPGAAYVGVKVSLNGMKEQVKRIDDNVTSLLKDSAKKGERLAVLESRMDRKEPNE